MNQSLFVSFFLHTQCRKARQAGFSFLKCFRGGDFSVLLSFLLQVLLLSLKSHFLGNLCRCNTELSIFLSFFFPFFFFPTSYSIEL